MPNFVLPFIYVNRLVYPKICPVFAQTLNFIHSFIQPLIIRLALVPLFVIVVLINPVLRTRLAWPYTSRMKRTEHG